MDTIKAGLVYVVFVVWLIALFVFDVNIYEDSDK